MTFDNWLKSNRTATEEKPSFDEWMKSRNTRHQTSDYASLLPAPASRHTLTDTGVSTVDEDLTQRILSGEYRNGNPSERYYSKPDDFMADVGNYASRVQTTGAAANSAYSNYSSAMSEATAAKNNLETLAAELRIIYSQYQANPSEANSRRYTDLHSQYEMAMSGYTTLSRTAERYAEEYNAAAADYADAYSAFTGYQQAEQGRYDDWKNTIRSEDDIQAEREKLEAALAENNKAYNAGNYEIDALHPRQVDPSNQALLEALQSQGYSVSDIDRDKKEGERLQTERRNLEDQLRLLDEEAEWSRYFKYADLQQKTDWNEKSQYTPKESVQNGPAAFGGSAFANYEDFLDAYINQDERALR